ncbi:MAG: glycosyltransferase family 2 protein [Holophagales bacterium]|nr:glycosyltransferase family 2 protein [Holophagales bacterium]
MSHPRDDEQPPLVSVVMPVRNEGAYIERSLGAVLAQSYGLGNMQILVVDGLSDDDTRERVAAIRERHPEATIELLDNPGRTAPCALNLGISRATGEVVVRVDGHCEIGTDYVANGVHHLSEGVADGVGGPLETVGETPTARAIAAAMGSPFGVGNSAFRTSEPGGPARVVDTVAFPAYTRRILDLAGPFDEELVRNQDDEYNYRLRKLGGRLLLVGDMPARYYSRGTFRSLFRQYFQYGLYKVRVLQKHPRQMSPRQIVPALFVLALLAGLVLGPFAAPTLGAWLGIGAPAASLLPLAAVAGPYLLANLAASVATWGRKREGAKSGPDPGLLFRLPRAYALLHSGYGLGFLVGLVRFANRWGDPR